VAEEATTLVFLVSDDPLVREEARYGFPSGTEVETYRDALDAQRGLDEHVPDVVIVDQQTGNAGGFALTRDMRSSDRLAKVPVLILLERAQDGWLAMQSGANRYRVKPLPTTTLVDETLDLIPA
jgi:DNA-binding response OmpR family regulator